MARNVRKCDRCGAMYEVYSKSYDDFIDETLLDGSIVFNRKIADVSKKALENATFDLCEDCFDALHTWITTTSTSTEDGDPEDTPTEDTSESEGA